MKRYDYEFRHVPSDLFHIEHDDECGCQCGGDGVSSLYAVFDTKNSQATIALCVERDDAERVTSALNALEPVPFVARERVAA